MVQNYYYPALGQRTIALIAISRIRILTRRSHRGGQVRVRMEEEDMAGLLHRRLMTGRVDRTMIM